MADPGDVELIVVGAGIAGSTLARVATAAGMSTILIDRSPGDAASRLAGAVIRETWVPRTLARSAVRYYQELEAVRTSTALYSHGRQPVRARPQGGYYLVDPVIPLMPPDCEGDARGQGAGRVRVNGEDVSARYIVWATGAATPATRSTYGAVRVSPTARLTEDCLLRYHQYHRFAATMLVAMPGGGVRVCASMARDQDAARRQIEAMEREATAQGLVTPVGDWATVVNRRCTWGNASPDPVRESARREWQFAGLHRTGYATAPAAAMRLLAMMQATA